MQTQTSSKHKNHYFRFYLTEGLFHRPSVFFFSISLLKLIFYLKTDNTSIDKSNQFQYTINIVYWNMYAGIEYKGVELTMKRVLAFDFGASSGRAMIGTFDGEKITLKEVHRFSNDPVSLGGTLYWDTLRQLFEIKQGLTKAKNDGGFSSVGIDTWGVDFALLDKDDRLLESAVHYRDSRTNGIPDETFKKISKERIYELTGIQFMDFNTIFQLYSLVKDRPELLERAKTMLFVPDLFSFFLSGKKVTEYTEATTGQIVDAYTKDISREIMDAISVPAELLPPIVMPGTVIGQLTDELCEELGLEKADVVAVGSHDTASAVVSVPASEEDFIYISCGTWSLFGTETAAPIIDEKSEYHNITNEGGAFDKITFLKNIIGLWLIQESRRQWIREGQEYSYAELERLALESKPFACFIDPDSPEFTPQGNIPKRVQEYCARTSQYVPQTVGEIMRCIYESLALKYRYAFDSIKDCTGKDYKNIYVVGGGVKDRLLCQMTAESCGVPVNAGPIEATVFGNIAVQLMASGDIKDLNEARRIIANSDTMKHYSPENHDVWEEEFKKFKAIIGK